MPSSESHIGHSKCELIGKLMHKQILYFYINITYMPFILYLYIDFSPSHCHTANTNLRERVVQETAELQGRENTS